MPLRFKAPKISPSSHIKTIRNANGLPSFHNITYTTEHFNTPLAFSFARQQSSCLYGHYGKVHTEAALLPCSPRHQCVTGACVGLQSSRPGLQYPLLRFRGPAQHLSGCGGGGESGLVLLPSTSNICWSSSAMLQVSARAGHTYVLQLCQQIQQQANIAYVINQAINPINLLNAFYFEARFPLSEESYSIWIKKK